VSIMRLFVNGNDFGECLACDFDLVERRMRMSTCGDTPIEGMHRHRLHQADRLARKLADQTALSMLDSCSEPVDRDGALWRRIEQRYFDGLEDSLLYLELRGMLERDLHDFMLVRLIEAK
jgi:hypothetical protein